MIQPATNLASGHRYIVVLREIKDADGKTIRAPEGLPRLPRRGSTDHVWSITELLTA